MSEWTGWKPFPLERRREDLSKFGEGRAPGLHVSQAIKRMKMAVGENVNPIPGEQDFLRPQIGFFWEYALEVMAATGCTVDEALTVALKRHASEDRTKLLKQIRLERDGIHGTPDGLDEDTGTFESYKATWRSFRGCDTLEGFEDKFWTWQLQEKAYCAMAGHLKCRWIVLWVCGDYSRPIGPRVLETTVTWTEDEVEQAWESIVAHCDEISEGGME